MDLHGDVCLLSGAGRGLGRAIALSLAKAGATVVGLARGAAEVSATLAAVESGGGRGLALSGDVTQPADVARAVSAALEAFGRIDLLVNAAGQFRSIGPLWESDPVVWWADVSTDLLGAYLCARSVLPGMLERGRGMIVNLVAPAADKPLAFGSSLSSAKTALARLTETLAAELPDGQVLVHAVNPGLVPTPLTQHLLKSPEGRRYLPQVTEAFAEGKEIAPEWTADLVVELARNRWRQLHGRVVHAAGGAALLRLRLARIARDELGVLRLR